MVAPSSVALLNSEPLGVSSCPACFYFWDLWFCRLVGWPIMTVGKKPFLLFLRSKGKVMPIIQMCFLRSKKSRKLFVSNAKRPLLQFLICSRRTRWDEQFGLKRSKRLESTSPCIISPTFSTWLDKPAIRVLFPHPSTSLSTWSWLSQRFCGSTAGDDAHCCLLMMIWLFAL